MLRPTRASAARRAAPALEERLDPSAHMAPIQWARAAILTLKGSLMRIRRLRRSFALSDRWACAGLGVRVGAVEDVALTLSHPPTKAAERGTPRPYALREAHRFGGSTRTRRAVWWRRMPGDFGWSTGSRALVVGLGVGWAPLDAVTRTAHVKPIAELGQRTRRAGRLGGD